MSRTALVALVVSGVMLVSLAVIPPIAELAIIAFAPGLIASAFSSGVRSNYMQNVRVAVLASGVAGAAWLIGSTGSEENVIGMLIAAGVSFILMIALGSAGAFLVDYVQRRRAA